MAITINIYYMGEGNNARLFAEEMLAKGIVKEIRNRRGNLRYEYFYPAEDNTTVLLIDSWENQKDLDEHHKSDIMGKILALREKYNLRMKVESFLSNSDIPESDKKFIKN